MAYEIRPDYSDGDNTPVDTSGTYLDLNPNQAIYDPGFLTDMRDFLEENGESPYLSDDEVRDKFFKDAVWRNLHVGSAIKNAFDYPSASEVFRCDSLQVTYCSYRSEADSCYSDDCFSAVVLNEFGDWTRRRTIVRGY